VTPGYWRQPEATKAAFVDGWFKTGDLGYFDDEGLLFLVDRKKDMFISGGENVYPAEIENLFAGFPEVGQVAVIGVPDPQWGEVGKAVVVPRAGRTIDGGDLIARCTGQIAKYKIPKSVEVVSELPLSAQGKVLKTELRSAMSAEALSSVAALVAELKAGYDRIRP
jgi:fatty-acyl-CoA synthase